MSQNNTQEKEKKGHQKEVQELPQKLEEIQKERDKMLAGWQRCRADFLNYKKEEAERFKQFVDYEKEDWLLGLLPILDHFERAKAEVVKSPKDPSIFDGFLQIQKSFEDFLKREGLEEIKTELGKKFDPNFEEVMETEVDKEKEDGTILAILQKGYKFKGKVIRPTRVKVSLYKPPNNN